MFCPTFLHRKFAQRSNCLATVAFNQNRSLLAMAAALAARALPTAAGLANDEIPNLNFLFSLMVASCQVLGRS